MNETQGVANYSTETVEQRKARLRAEDTEEKAARERQIEAASAPTRHLNAEYFSKQEALAKQIAEQNAKNAAAQVEREKAANERNTAEAKARIEALHGNKNKPPEGFLDMAGTIPCKRNPSITLQPKPDSDSMRPTVSQPPPKPLTEDEKEAAVRRMNAYLASKY